ncbi:hypothetical protein ACK6GM_002351 [Escherichia coli]|uniref:hypothetical protein n=1 Tax=Escherichia coli TaxID=562 RepID=UPI0023ED39B7|nr:hypothetical protein [Escherichia coli]MDF4181398.1 hypothetical protein [Escherichia coli]HAW7454185.1 hypothetical protein [Escherichia coli]HAW7613030.1 hypothetical protein [Escherichia coli]
MKTFIKAESVTDCSITDNIYPPDMESFIDAKVVTNTEIARNRPDESRLEDALKQILTIIERSELNVLEINRIHDKVGQLKQETSSQTKMERYKELVELINLHKELLSPIYPQLHEWVVLGCAALERLCS